MASDDVIYGGLLLISIPSGLIFRRLNGEWIREAISSLLGVIIIGLTCREHSVHSLVVTIVNTLIITLYKKHKRIAVYSLLWCFSYLAFFRTCHWFGIDKPLPHSNAVQLIITLRLVGLASEVLDIESLKTRVSRCDDVEEKQKLQLELEYKIIDTSVLRMLAYSFGYIGALTGPFYTCRTHQDMISNKYSGHIPLKESLLQTLRPLPVCASLFILTSLLVSTKAMTADEFYTENSCAYRYIYLVVIFIWFRMRFYSAWILAECMAITAGLGAYPTLGKSKPGGGPSDIVALKDLDSAGKKDVQYDFHTINNIKPYETEFAVTCRSSIKTWNQTVQWWLVVHIYKKIPGTKFFRGFILMLVSAFWHGVHPGYYATFLSAPFLLLAEDGMNKAVRLRLRSERARSIYDNVASFVRMRSFEYMGVGAFLLQYHQIVRYWSSLYFYGHVFLGALIVIGQVLLMINRNDTKDK